MILHTHYTLHADLRSHVEELNELHGEFGDIIVCYSGCLHS